MGLRLPFSAKWPVIAVLLQKRGKTVTVKIDKASFFVKDDVKIYELKKAGLKFQPSKFKNILSTDTGKPFIILLEYERGMVVPISTDDLREIYEYTKDGKVVMELMKYECKNKHRFEKPVIKKVGKLKPKDIQICPYCNSSDITEFPEPIKSKKIDRIVNLHAVNQDMAFWGQMRRWKAEERHKKESWLVKNKELVIFTLMFVFGIVCMYYVSTVVGSNTDAVVGALDRFVNTWGATPPG